MAKEKTAASRSSRRSRSAAAAEGTATTEAAQVDAPVTETPPVFDLVGEDGRRLCRSWSRDACKELQARVSAQTAEKTRIVPASPFTSVQLEQP